MEAIKKNPQDLDKIKQVQENLKTLVDEAPDRLHGLNKDELEKLLDSTDEFTKSIEIAQKSIDKIHENIPEKIPEKINTEGEISNLIIDSFPCHAEVLKVIYIITFQVITDFSRHCENYFGLQQSLT